MIAQMPNRIRDHEQTDLRSLETEKMRREFLQQLILPEEIPFRFDPGIGGRERVGFLAQFPIHSRNARAVRQENREREQQHQAGEPEQEIAQREAREKISSRAARRFSPSGGAIPWR